MHIIACRPEADRGSGAPRTIARFDCQVADNVRMFDLVLRQRPDGTFVAYPPKNSRNCVGATFAAALSNAITTAAVAALNPQKGQKAHDFPTI
jgi:hypothetical protein